MPRRKSASQARENWQSGLANAGPRIEQGVRAVTTAPGQKAAQKKDKYLAGVNASANLWAQRVAAVDLGSWQNATIAGAARVAEGAQAKGAKYENALTPVLAHMDSVLATVDSMPDNTLEQRIAKSAAYARGMAQYKQRAGS